MKETPILNRALVIPAGGTPYTIMVNRPEGDIINKIVGGWFDCVRDDKFHGYVNDTGLIDGLPLNPVASVMFGQLLAGDAILFGSFSASGEYDGYEHSIDPQVVVVANSLHLMWETQPDNFRVHLKKEVVVTPSNG
jgi:hypothetical protein